MISGAEQAIQNLWKLSGTMHGWAVSAALWGTVIGALFGGIPTAKYGRKKVLVSVGFLYFVSALASGFAPEVYSFIIGRFIGGLGVGAATVVSPMSISEISPAKNRGKLAGLFQFNIVLICLIAFIASHAMGQGAVIWVFIAEIFPNDHRAASAARWGTRSPNSTAPRCRTRHRPRRAACRAASSWTIHHSLTLGAPVQKLSVSNARSQWPPLALTPPELPPRDSAGSRARSAT